MRTFSTLAVVLLVLALGLLLVWHVGLALTTGVAQAAGGRKYPRRKRPLVYWLAILAQTLLAAGALFAVARVLHRLFG